MALAMARPAHQEWGTGTTRMAIGIGKPEEACQKKDWKGHKEMCKASTQLRQARFKTSQKLDRYRNKIRQRSRTGKGFQIVSAAIGAASFEDAPFLLCQGDDDGVHGQEQVLVLTWGGAAPKQMF